MIIANFGDVGKSIQERPANTLTEAIREHHERPDTFVVYDVQPRAPPVCG